MGTRKTEIEKLASTLRDYGVVTDVWLAKSFTDQLLVVNLQEGTAFPTKSRSYLSTARESRRSRRA